MLLILNRIYLFNLTDIIKTGVVDGFSHVLDGPLGVGWSNDLVLPKIEKKMVST